MGIPDRVSPDHELPEQRLLRDGDRLQDYAGAFLRGEITAQQYSELTLAEINRRAPIDPTQPLGATTAMLATVEHVVHEEPPLPPPPPVVHQAPARPQRTDRDRSIVLARAFVTGRIRGADFLRLMRDC